MAIFFTVTRMSVSIKIPDGLRGKDANKADKKILNFCGSVNTPQSSGAVVAGWSQKLLSCPK